jgi:hypothetical protein
MEYFRERVLVDVKGIHLYVMLIPLAMWSVLSLFNYIYKGQLLNLFHLGPRNIRGGGITSTARCSVN